MDQRNPKYDILKHVIKYGSYDDIRGILKYPLYTKDKLSCYLIYALARESINIVRLLIEYGADLNFRITNEQKTLVTQIVEHNISDTGLFLQNEAIKFTSFAIQLGLRPSLHYVIDTLEQYDIQYYDKFVQYLLDKGASPEFIDDHKNSLLMTSKKIQYLKYCNITQRNDKDETILCILSHTYANVSPTYYFWLPEKITKLFTTLIEISVDQNFEKALLILGPEKSYLIKGSGYYRYNQLKAFTSKNCYGSIIPRDIVGIIEEYLKMDISN